MKHLKSNTELFKILETVSFNIPDEYTNMSDEELDAIKDMLDIDTLARIKTKRVYAKITSSTQFDSTLSDNIKRDYTIFKEIADSNDLNLYCTHSSSLHRLTPYNDYGETSGPIVDSFYKSPAYLIVLETKDMSLCGLVYTLNNTDRNDMPHGWIYELIVENGVVTGCRSGNEMNASGFEYNAEYDSIDY